VGRNCFQHSGVAATVMVAVALITACPSRSQNYSGAASVATPHTSDGKPDLSGTWQDRAALARNKVGSRDVGVTISKDEGGNGVYRFGSRRCSPTQKGTEGKGCFEETNETADLEFTFRTDPNRPVYKPEYWDKVQDLDYNTNTKDPQFTCMPLGLPRMGAPAQIIQTLKYVVFLYGGYPSNQFRIIPIDGRGHDPVRAKDISYFGDAIGHWEGDALVVESLGFNDETWIASGSRGGGGGYFHSYDMKVTERLRREGNVIHYQAMVDDPTVLLQPWVMTAKELDLDPDPKAYLQEGDQCSQPDPGLFTGKIRH
jgi:hypothetical protein